MSEKQPARLPSFEFAESSGARPAQPETETFVSAVTAENPKARRIGVYVCHCGGNISDYVDVQAVVDAVKDEPGVVVAKHTVFACSDAGQQEMQEDIEANQLDGLVVASCSPKLHVVTFRGVARRSGMNPYEYNQANIREQVSWTHTDDPSGATHKAIGVVRGVIGRTRLSDPLETLEIKTQQKALVIGGGIAGLRAAIGLADVGLAVVLIERERELGGWLGRFGRIFPHDREGRALVERLVEEIRKRPDITVFTGADVASKTGSFGNYQVGIRVSGSGDSAETISVTVGSIVVATGMDTYQVPEGDFGMGLPGVVTLPDFKTMVDAAKGPLVVNGRPVRSLAYVYCVGGRGNGGNAYCSRFCCTATAHTAVSVAGLDPKVRQYHLYRDVRTYGSFELLYTEARKTGSVYVKYPDEELPIVETDGKTGGLKVTVKDLLSGGDELEIPVDLVVLVTGAVPRHNEELTGILKLPLGKDGFYNEIHPKLRPVETMVDGVLIAGASQGPKSSAESVASALAAVTQSAAVLKKGVAELDPLVAMVDPDRCDNCGKCLTACPYDAIKPLSLNGREVVTIDEATCKGCGGCVPVCPQNAIDLRGYTDGQITAMIDGLLEEALA